MRIHILKLGAGPRGVRVPGDFVDVDDREGQMLIADGAGELAEAPAKAPMPMPATPVAIETAEAPMVGEIPDPPPPKRGAGARRSGRH